MVTFISKSPEETLALGERWGREAKAGQVLALTGDLGSGKTQLVKGIAAGLGFSGRVHSPTFALVNQYRGGRLPLVHLDFYRLETREQIERAGLGEYLDRPEGLTVVEWAERWLGNDAESPPGWMRVQLEVASENVRVIRYEDSRA